MLLANWTWTIPGICSTGVEWCDSQVFSVTHRRGIKLSVIQFVTLWYLLSICRVLGPADPALLVSKSQSESQLLLSKSNINSHSVSLVSILWDAPFILGPWYIQYSNLCDILSHIVTFGLCYQQWWYISPEIRLRRACEFLLTLSHHLKLIIMFLGEALLGFSQVSLFFESPPKNEESKPSVNSPESEWKVIHQSQSSLQMAH